MSTDPLLRLPSAIGDVLVRHRKELRWPVEALAAGAGLSPAEIASMEDGSYSPTLVDLFRIAKAFDEQPTILLCDVITAWRANLTDTLHQSRVNDFTRLFRLGYQHKPGDFRELATSYYSVAEATHAAVRLNEQRHARRVAVLDTVCIYVRLDYLSLRSSGQGASGATSIGNETWRVLLAWRYARSAFNGGYHRTGSAKFATLTGRIQVLLSVVCAVQP